MKKFLCLIASALMLISCGHCPKLTGNGEIILTDGWKISSESVGRSFPAEVPSTVAGALVEAGYFPLDLLVTGTERNMYNIERGV